MSFGDPNNPYGPPQGQQPPAAPGYGYPQQPGMPPQGQPYPNYPAQAGYGGYSFPAEMPGLMKTARVLLFILGGLQILVGLVAGVVVGGAQDASNGIGSGDETSALAGLGLLIAALMLCLGALSIFLGVKFKNGRSGIRITTIVYASLMILGGLVNTINGAGGSGTFGGLISLAMAGIILASMVNSAAGAWFNRPRY